MPSVRRGIGESTMDISVNVNVRGGLSRWDETDHRCRKKGGNDKKIHTKYMGAIYGEQYGNPCGP